MGIEEYRNRINNASEIMKALGHPTRFCIVTKLMKGSLNVSQMQECLDVAQSNVSQHLTILKAKGIISGERNGSEILYSLVDEEVKRIVNTFFCAEDIGKV